MNYNEFNSDKEKITFTVKLFSTSFIITALLIYILYKLTL